MGAAARRVARDVVRRQLLQRRDVRCDRCDRPRGTARRRACAPAGARLPDRRRQRHDALDLGRGAGAGRPADDRLPARRRRRDVDDGAVPRPRRVDRPAEVVQPPDGQADRPRQRGLRRDLRPVGRRAGRPGPTRRAAPEGSAGRSTASTPPRSGTARSPAPSGRGCNQHGYDFAPPSLEPGGGLPPSWKRDLGWMVAEGAPWMGRRAKDLGPWVARKAWAEVKRVPVG